MKRITTWFLSTVTVVVLMFGYHTSTSSVLGTATPPAVTSGSTSANSGSGTGSGSGNGSGSGSGNQASAKKTTSTTVTGTVAQTEWGPVQVQLTVGGGRITDVAVLQYPSGNGRDERDQRLRTARPDPGDDGRPERAASTWSAGPPSPASGTTPRSRAPWTRPGCDRRPAGRTAPRRAGHGPAGAVALRGRQADGPAADAAWAAVLADLREADRVFSTWRDDSFVSRLDRGEVLAADGPPEVAEVLALGERARVESRGAFDVVRDGRLDPSGVVKGWAVDRAARHLRGLEDTDFCLSAGGDMVVHVADPGRPDWRVGIEDARDPSRVVAVVPLRHGALATSGLAHRGAHVVDARTGRAPTASALRHRRRPRPHRRRHRRHRGPRPGRRRAPAGWPPAPPARRTSSGPTAAPRRSPVPDSP